MGDEMSRRVGDGGDTALNRIHLKTLPDHKGSSNCKRRKGHQPSLSDVKPAGKGDDNAPVEECRNPSLPTRLDPIDSNSYWLRGQYDPQHAPPPSTSGSGLSISKVLRLRGLSP